MAKAPKILLTGANGQLGKGVTDALIARGLGPLLIACTRQPETLEGLKAAGVELRKADFDMDLESLSRSFLGAERMLLISTDAVGARKEPQAKAVEAAKKAGVKHLLYTSIYESPSLSATIGADHIATEKAIIGSGMRFSILRNHYYFDNLLASMIAARQSGSMIGSAAQGKCAFVTREDCALVAAATLADFQAPSEILNITGPQALSYAEVAEILGMHFEKQIKYINLDPKAHQEALEKWGLSGELSRMILGFDRSFKLGEAARVSPDVHKKIGRGARGLKDFLEVRHTTAKLIAKAI